MQYGFDHGIDDFSFPPTIGFKRKGQMPVEIPFDYDREQTLTKGTGIAFDIGFMHKGYCSDWGRSLYYGKAPEIVKDGYAALQAGVVNMINKIKPYETEFFCQPPETEFSKDHFETGSYDYLVWYYEDGAKVHRMNGYMEKCGYAMREL